MKRALVLLLIFVFCARCGWAMDWVRLNEKASRMKPEEINIGVSGGEEELYVGALVLLRYHKNDEAEALFKRMLKLDSSSVYAKWGMAEVMRRRHRLKESEEALKDCIKRDPKYYPALLTLSSVRYLHGDFNSSSRLAIKVLSDKENVDSANYVRALVIYGGSKGMIAHHAGPLSKAINGTAVLPALKKAERLDPDSAFVAMGLGVFYLFAPGVIGGDPERSKPYLHKAVENDPLLADAYVRLAQAYKASGDDGKYREYLEKARSIDPGNELLEDVTGGKCLFICN